MNPNDDRNRTVRATTSDGVFSLQYRFNPTRGTLPGNVLVNENDLKWDFIIDVAALRSIGWLKRNDSRLAVTGQIKGSARPILCEDGAAVGSACFGNSKSHSYVRWLNSLDCDNDTVIDIDSVVYEDGMTLRNLFVLMQS